MQTRRPPLGLIHSFGLFVVLPRLLIISALTLSERFLHMSPPVLFGLLALDLVIFALQFHHFQRAGDAHIRATGAMIPVWGGYLTLLVAAFLGASLWWGIGLKTYAPAPGELFTDRMDREHAARYDLALAPDGQSIVFKGEITFGVTRKLDELLQSAPQVQSMSLSSDGGHIYEARGMARLIRQAGLNTRALGRCASACTLVFVAGRDRELAPGARLGFHQYALMFGSPLPHIDLQAEQEKDRALFLAQGVNADFVARMFDAPDDQMWFPTRAQAQAANLITPSAP